MTKRGQFQRELERRLEVARDDLIDRLKAEFDDRWHEEVERILEEERDRLLSDIAVEQREAFIEREFDRRLELIEEEIREHLRHELTEDERA